MIKTMGSEEVRTSWRETLDVAQGGGTVVIERHKQPVAVLVNASEWERLRKAHIEELKRRSRESEMIPWEDAKKELASRGLIDYVDDIDRV